jgi:hypothetical protein
MHYDIHAHDYAQLRNAEILREQELKSNNDNESPIEIEEAFRILAPRVRSEDRERFKDF